MLASAFGRSHAMILTTNVHGYVVVNAGATGRVIEG